MALARFKASNHPQQVSRRWPDEVDGVDDRATHRTEQQWWQLMVEPFRDRASSPLSARFLPGWMRFLKPGQTAVGPNQRPPFGCVLLVWRPGERELVYDPNEVRGGLFG